MKLLIPIILLLFVQISFGQIKIDVFGPQTHYFKDGKLIEADKVIRSEGDEPESMEIIKEAFATFNLRNNKDRFSKAIQLELDEIESLLRSYTSEFHTSAKNGLFQSSNVASSSNGNVGEARFYSLDKDMPSLSISYSYDSRIQESIVNSVVISRGGKIIKRYPTLYDELKVKLSAIEKIDKQPNNVLKILEYEATIQFMEERIDLLGDYLPNPKKTLSDFQGSLSWFYNIEGQGDKAVKNAKNGLSNHSDNVWINTNLALGLLISGDLEGAKKIYQAHMDTPFRGGTLRSMFKQDLIEVSSQGILIPNKNEIEKLLQE